jgi:hypothetical protein
MTEPDVTAGPSGVWVHTKFYWFNFLLALCKPYVGVDGAPPVRGPWGARFIPLTPGSHSVGCYISYLWYRRMGDSTTQVNVPASGVLSIQWRAPWLVFLAGKWKSPDSKSDRR